MNQAQYKEYKHAYDILNCIGGICATQEEVNQAYATMKRLGVEE